MRVLTLLSGGERLRQVTPLPAGGALQRLDRPRLVDVYDSVELVRQTGVKVVTPALGFWPVDHTDRPLQPRLAQPIQHDAAIAQQEHEIAWRAARPAGRRPHRTLGTDCARAHGVEQRLVAVRQGRAHALALD